MQEAMVHRDSVLSIFEEVAGYDYKTNEKIRENLTFIVR
jgi:hypothetical protein